jgi:hypothetical protein
VTRFASAVWQKESGNMGPSLRNIPNVLRASAPAGWTRRERAIAMTATLLVLGILVIAAWLVVTAHKSPVAPAEPVALLLDPLPDSLLTRDDGFDCANPHAGDVGDSRQPTDTLPAESVPRPAPIVCFTSPARQAENVPASGTQATLTAPNSQMGSSNAAPGVTQPPATTASTAVPVVAPSQKTIQPQKPAPEETLAGLEPDGYEENGAEDFVCPVPWLENSRMIERVKYLSSLQNLLKAGWEEKPTALDTARSHFESARALCADDPRLPYAFGLVLWKHDRHAEARCEWEKATRIGTQPYLPAYAVLAWAMLMDDELAPGFAAIERLTEAVVRSHGAYPTASQRTHAALFLGRAIGFFKGPGNSPELIDRVVQTEKKLLERLPAEFRQTFEQGEAQASRRYAEFVRLARRPQADVVAELHREQKRLADEIATLRHEVKQHEDRQRQIPREAKAHFADLDREADELEGKIYQWTTGIGQGNGLAANLAQPRQIFAGYETVSFRRWVPEKGTGKDKDDGHWENDTKSVARYRDENPLEIQSRLREREQVLATLRTRSQELTQFSDRYKDIPRERTETAKSLRLERIEVARTAAATRHKIGELVLQERDLGKDFTTPAEIQKRMASLAPYIPWSPETDREKLSASYRQKPTKSVLSPAAGDRQKAGR